MTLTTPTTTTLPTSKPKLDQNSTKILNINNTHHTTETTKPTPLKTTQTSPTTTTTQSTTTTIKPQTTTILTTIPTTITSTHIPTQPPKIITHIIPKEKTTNNENLNTSKLVNTLNTQNSSQLPIFVGVILIIFVVPVLTYGCVCCQEDFTLGPSTQILKLTTTSYNLPERPLGGLIAANAIWFLHSVLQIFLSSYLPLHPDSKIFQQMPQIMAVENQLSFLTPLLLWTMAPISRIFFAFNWQSVFLGGVNPFNISIRFLAFGCLGQIVGSIGLSWLGGAETKVREQSISLNTFHRTILALLVTAYLLFIWLWATVHKAERQMQIIQLSGAINGIFNDKDIILGKSPEPSSNKPVKSRTTKKGKYKALLETVEDESRAASSDSDFALDFVLTEPGHSTNADTDSDFV